MFHPPVASTSSSGVMLQSQSRVESAAGATHQHTSSQMGFSLQVSPQLLSPLLMSYPNCLGAQHFSSAEPHLSSSAASDASPGQYGSSSPSQIISTTHTTPRPWCGDGSAPNKRELGESCADQRKKKRKSIVTGRSDSNILSIGGVRMKKVKGTRKKVREPRFCFKTMSDVDVLDDGYKWRKYGQKVVKNNQHPRSYYRCTQDSCRVKKRIERLAEDPRMVITTYEGRHAHSPPHDDDDESQLTSSKLNLFW